MMMDPEISVNLPSTSIYLANHRCFSWEVYRQSCGAIQAIGDYLGVPHNFSTRLNPELSENIKK